MTDNLPIGVPSRQEVALDDITTTTAPAASTMTSSSTPSAGATSTQSPSPPAAAVVVVKKREKFKDSNGTRVRDEHGYRLRAAGLCTREVVENGQSRVELLLVSGRGNPKQWVLPGGGIEESEDGEQAAIREVYEEAGVRGTIRSLVGQFTDDERLARTLLFLVDAVEICDDWEERRQGRQRRWLTIADALANIKTSQRVMLERYIDALSLPPTI